MKIVYYHPFPSSDALNGGYAVRPVMMLQAFRDLGVDVDLILGKEKDRRDKIIQIKHKVKMGEEYDFVYVEDTSRPLIFLDGVVPQWSLYDLRFFLWLNQKKIPIGWFYRDINWKLRYINKKSWSIYKYYIGRIIFELDLKLLNKIVTKLYLPSISMAHYISFVDRKKIDALPPGHGVDCDKLSEKKIQQHKKISSKYNFIYVGGLSQIYEIHEFVKAISRFDNMCLKICTRPQDWAEVANEYQQFMHYGNITIIHANINELENHYDWADFGVLVTKPTEIWSFNSPIKFYEYIGKGIPIIATIGTNVAKHVSNYDIGWTVEYNVNAIESMLRLIEMNPELVYEKQKNLSLICREHTWQSRAKKVIKDMKFISATNNKI